MKTAKPYEKPGQQLFWKMTLTFVGAIVGAVLAYYLFRAS